VVGTGLAGHAVGSNLDTGSSDLAPALAGDASGSAAAPAMQIAMSMSVTLRILAPNAWMLGTPEGYLFMANGHLIHDH
jgi:hypothetical protein